MSYSINLKNPNFLKVMSSEMANAVPKAISDALSQMAYTASTQLKKDIPSELKKKGNKFISNSVAYTRSSKSSLQSEVGILERVRFAELLVDGGQRTPQLHKYIAIPLGAKDSNGRARKAMAPSKILSKRGYFIFDHNGKVFIAKVVNKTNIKPMYILVKKTDYQKEPYIHWQEDVEKSIKDSNFAEIYMQKLTKILG